MSNGLSRQIVCNGQSAIHNLINQSSQSQTDEEVDVDEDERTARRFTDTAGTIRA